VDEHSSAGRADLALVEEQAHRGAVDGRFDVGVGQDDLRRLPTEFERDPLERLGCGDLDRMAGSGLPVKLILSTPGWSMSACPATDPTPGTTFTAPAGSPASASPP
jgi:hypothetical protein